MKTNLNLLYCLGGLLLTLELASNRAAAQVNVVQPGDAIVLYNGSNDGDPDAWPPPDGETVDHAIDRNTQKYLNFLDLGSGFIVSPTLGSSFAGTIVTGIRFYTANDAPERDPMSYLLEGSVTGAGGPFTVIWQGALDLPLGRNPAGQQISSAMHFNQLVNFANNNAYTTYRVTFPTLRDPAVANSMQIGEVELLGRVASPGCDFNDWLLPPGTSFPGAGNVGRIADDGTGSNCVVHLTDANQGGAFGVFSIPAPAGGSNLNKLHMHWRSLVGGDNGAVCTAAQFNRPGADGYSMSWGTDLPNPPSYGNPGEEGAGNGLIVTVDTFDNSVGEAPGLEIKWRGARVAFDSINADPGLAKDFLRKGTFVEADLTVDTSGQATFTYDGRVLTAPLLDWGGIAGGGCIMFAARTGGACDNHWIDDLLIEKFRPPTIICPSNLTVQCLSNVPPCPTTLAQFLAQGGAASNNCNTNLTYSCLDDLVDLGPCGSTIIRTQTVLDDCGLSASCIQIITIRDTIAPTITCPSNLTVQCLSNVPPCPTTLAQFRAQGGTASDNCDTNLTYSCTDGPLVGGVCGGTISRTHRVTDDCTNSANCIQLITIRDTILPTITCPSNLTVQCLSNVPPCPTTLAQFRAQGGTASDNCDTNLTYSCTDGPLVGGVCGGTISRTHRVTDDCTNAASCIQLITIRDTIPPSIHCSSNLVAVSTDPTGARVTYTATATDNCDPNVTVSCEPPSGSLFPPGTTSVLCTASDVCSNRSQCSFTVTVLLPPSITTQPQSQTVVAGNNATFTVVASGTEPLSYQWRLNGTNLSGATGANYTVFSTQPGAYLYAVVVSNAAGSVTSAMATLTVLLGGELVLSPANGPVGRAVSVGVVGLPTFLAGQTMLISFDGNLIARQMLVACDQQVGGAGFGLLCDGGPVSVVVPVSANGPHVLAVSTATGDPHLEATFIVGPDFEATTFAGQTAPGQLINGTNGPLVNMPDDDDDKNPELEPPLPPGRFVPRRDSLALSVREDGHPLGFPGAARSPTDPLKIIKNSGFGSLLLGGSGDPPDVSVASSGKVVLYAANTFGAYSADCGNTFTLLNPFTLFPPTNSDGSTMDGGFCCDQIVVYVPLIDRFIWLIQLWKAPPPSLGNTNRYRFAVASPADIITSKGTLWQTFDLTSRDLGLDGWMDYPGLAVGTSFLYLTANAVMAPGKSLIVRIPLTDFLASGASRLNFRAFASSAGEFRLVQNCGVRQFWANRKDYSTMRIYYWDEINEPDKVRWNDYTVPTSPAPNFDSPAPNNANWLSFGGPPSGNLSSGTLAGNELWLAWNAGPDPETVPAGRRITQPRIDMVRFHAATFEFLEYRSLWYPDYAYAYGYLASTSDGEVGISFAWGGNHAKWPNHAVGFLTGNSELVNTTASTWSAERFGDYLSLRRHYPDGRLLAAAGYATWVHVGAYPYTYDPHYVLFGRSSVPEPICLDYTLSGGGFEIRVPTEVGRTYAVEMTDDLSTQGVWTPAPGGTFQGTGSIVTVNCGQCAGPGAGFFRARVILNP